MVIVKNVKIIGSIKIIEIIEIRFLPEVPIPGRIKGGRFPVFSASSDNYSSFFSRIFRQYDNLMNIFSPVHIVDPASAACLGRLFFRGFLSAAAVIQQCMFKVE